MKPKHIIVLVILAAVAAVVAPPLLRMQERSAVEAAFESTFRNFGSIRWEEAEDGLKSGKLNWGTRASSIPKGDLPTLTGRILMMRPARVNYGTGKARELPPALEPLFLDLPAELRATTPAEVKTLVHFCPQTTSQHYQEVGGSRTAVLAKLIVELRIFDVGSQTLLGVWSLEGDNPPSSFREDEWPRLGAPPVVEFLAALPRAP